MPRKINKAKVKALRSRMRAERGKSINPSTIRKFISRHRKKGTPGVPPKGSSYRAQKRFYKVYNAKKNAGLIESGHGGSRKGSGRPRVEGGRADKREAKELKRQIAEENEATPEELFGNKYDIAKSNMKTLPNRIKAANTVPKTNTLLKQHERDLKILAKGPKGTGDYSSIIDRSGLDLIKDRKASLIASGKKEFEWTPKAKHISGAKRTAASRDKLKKLAAKNNITAEEQIKRNKVKRSINQIKRLKYEKSRDKLFKEAKTIDWVGLRKEGLSTSRISAKDALELPKHKVRVELKNNKKIFYETTPLKVNPNAERHKQYVSFAKKIERAKMKYGAKNVIVRAGQIFIKG